MTGFLFSKGKIVEVSLPKEEYPEVWFPATVQEETGNGYLVERHIRQNDGVPESVKVIIDYLRIRPSPPQVNVTNYLMSEKVDAYIDFGWWNAVITKELPDNKYMVRVKRTKIEMQVNQSEIRPHMEWKDGSWFSANQDTLASSDYQGLARNVSYSVHQTEMVSPGSFGTPEGNSEERAADPINSQYNRPEQSTPSNKETAIFVTSEKRKMLSRGTDGCLRPSKKMKEANKSDVPPLLTYNLNSSPVNSPGEETNFGIAAPSNGSAGTSSVAQNMIDFLSVNFSQARRPRSKRYPPPEPKNLTSGPSQRNDGRLRPITETRALVGDKPGNPDNHTPEPLSREGDRLPISQIGGTKILGDKNDDAVTSTEENRVQKECIIEGGPITFNLDDEVIEGAHSKDLSCNPKDKSAEVSGDQNLRVHDPEVDRIKEGDQVEGQGNTIQRRKRGRPRKNLGKSLEVSQPNGDVAAAGMASKDVLKNYALPVVVGLPATNLNGSSPNKKNVNLDVGKQISYGSVEQNSTSSSKVEVYPWRKDNVQCGRFVPASAEKDEMDSPKRGRRRTISVNAESSNQDPEVLCGSKTAEANGKYCLVKEAETSIVQLPCNFSDDRSLSMSLEAPMTTDATSASQGRNVEQFTHVSQKDKAVLSLQCNDQGLPFAKSSPLWKTIESMDEFRQFPQNPHFQTLGSEMEGTREGSAIALMVNFANVVKQTSNLQFDEPKTRSIIDENLKILDKLEQNGFDVKVVRDRLEKLGDMKETQKVLGGHAKEFEDQITEKKHENLKIDDRIKEVENQIKLLQEEKARIMASKEENDSSIAIMQSTVDGIGEDVRNVRSEFETLVAKPWASA